MAADILVDATLFMGMHCRDESVRVACKNFFVGHLDEPVVMNLEQVGRCDDLVWGYPRDVQDAYYPFMDNLHSDMTISRVPYDRSDIEAGLSVTGSDGLRMDDRMLVGMVRSRGAVLHTVSPRLLARRASLPVEEPAPGRERAFPGRIEDLYLTSLALRVPTGRL